MAQIPPKDDDQRASSKHPEKNEYPLQEVFQHEGGYRFVIGNEKGKQFVAEWHPSGSHTIHHPDGSVTSWTIGDHKVAHKGGKSVTIGNNGDVLIAGHSSTATQGGEHKEVAGDSSSVVGGKTNIIALGGMGMAVQGNMYMGTTGAISMNPAGGLKIVGNVELEGNLTMKGDIALTGDINQKGVHKDNKGEHIGGGQPGAVPTPSINQGSPLTS